MADKGMAGGGQEVHPMSAEDAGTEQPPPSYEEAMGQFVTSVTHGKLPALSYIDIMPRMTDPGNIKNGIAPTFEKFSDIMRGGNIWLQNNPGLRVWKCETVERKVEVGPIVQLDTTLHHESSYGANYYVFGVRLWLTKRRDPSEPIQELGLLNVPPPVKEIPVTMVSHGGMMGMGMGMAGMPVMRFGRRRGMAVVTQGMIQTYEVLSKAVDSFNDYVQDDPLPGYILNVETASVKFGDNFSGSEADPDVTSWSEKGKSLAFCTRRVTKILRVFYVKGAPRKETLKMTTFLPKVLRQPEWNKAAQFEPFEDVVCRAQQWVHTLQGSRVVSIETRSTEYHSGFGQPVAFTEDSTDDVIMSFKDRNMVRYLRVFYVTDSSAASYASTTMTSRLFVPMNLGGRRFESMTQTVARINCWLAVTGLPIFSVETVPSLLTASNRVETSKVNYVHTQTSGNYWLTCIRLYFPTPFTEPPAIAIPNNPASGSSQSSSCTLL